MGEVKARKRRRTLLQRRAGETKGRPLRGLQRSVFSPISERDQRGTAGTGKTQSKNKIVVKMSDAKGRVETGRKRLSPGAGFNLKKTRIMAKTFRCIRHTVNRRQTEGLRFSVPDEEKIYKN